MAALNLKELKAEYDDLTNQLTNPELISQWRKFQEISKKRGYLEKVIKKAEELEEVKQQLEQSKEMLSGQDEIELATLAEEEFKALSQKEEQLEKELSTLLKGDKDSPTALIMEIRPGTGGDEASLFARDLYEMYSKYITKKGWKQNVLNLSDTETGGIKEVSFEIQGEGAFDNLEYEAGVHRVQRIPVTEKAGRVHTSTASVAVLPKPKKEQIQIRPEDIKIDFTRSSGAGGQNVNKRETAVRLTHIPTGVVVESQTQRSQQQNKENAMSILAAKILEQQKTKEEKEFAGARKAQIGTAERSEKIRTYNFPQDRVTDHRVQLSWHGLPSLLEGDLDGMIEDLKNEIESVQN